jgi:hypothetical protein
MGWWDRLPACQLGMTGKMPVATKSFSSYAITFENGHSGGQFARKHEETQRRVKMFLPRRQERRGIHTRFALSLSAFSLRRKALFSCQSLNLL